MTNAFDPEESASSLGRAIAVRRAELGLKRKELAVRAQLSYPYVSELENGTKEPSARALQQLADALEMSRTELMALSDKYAGAGDPLERRMSPVPRPAQALALASPPSLGAPSETLHGLAADVAELVARLVQQELERFVRDELPMLVAAELQRTLTNALAPNSQRPR